MTSTRRSSARFVTHAVVIALLASSAACGARQPYADGNGLVGQLEREVTALRQKNRGLEDRLATCATTGSVNMSLYTELIQIFAATEVNVAREAGRLRITMPEAMLFSDPFALSFRDEATMALDLLATALALHPETHVEVQGHSDDTMLPTAAKRWYRSRIELSFHQALAVSERLQREFKLDSTRFSVTSWGANLPLDSNDLPSGQARNRRIVLELGPGPTRRPW